MPLPNSTVTREYEDHNSYSWLLRTYRGDWENKCIIFSAFFKVNPLRTYRGVASKALSKNHNSSFRGFKRRLACWCAWFRRKRKDVVGATLFVTLILEWHVTCTSHNVFSHVQVSWGEGKIHTSILVISRSMSDLSYTQSSFLKEIWAFLCILLRSCTRKESKMNTEWNKFWTILC